MVIVYIYLEFSPSITNDMHPYVFNPTVFYANKQGIFVFFFFFSSSSHQIQHSELTDHT